MSAVPVGETSHDTRAPADLPVQSLDHVVGADAPAVPVREFGQEVGGGLTDPLAQAVRRAPQLPGFHLRGDGSGLVQRGFPGLHGEYRLQGRRRPFPVDRRRLGVYFVKLRWTCGGSAVLLDSSLIPSPPIMP